MTTKLNWRILGTGSIAKTFANALAQSQAGVLRAVGSRTTESAEKFASEYSGTTPHGTYEEFLADPNVEAIYISLPNHLHCE
jgi:predicted dehydrogenase